MMNDSISDFMLRGVRPLNSTSRTWRRCLRKRRANSDSEISLPLVDYVSHGFVDDSAIDLLSDSMDRIEHHMSSKATMDPSQMFIGCNNPTNNFSSVTSSVGINNMNLISDGSHMNTTPMTDGLDNTIATSIFSTQIFYVDTLVPDSTVGEGCSHSVHQNNTLDLVGEMNGTVYNTNPDPPETIPRHIPAKYRKSLVPIELLSKPLVSPNISQDYAVNQQWITNRSDKQELKEKGIEWKNGLWSTEEEEILRANIDDYCEKNSIVDPTLMIFSTSKDVRKQFYRKISKGLNRTLFAVYRKVTRMYDTRNYVGKYTKEEEFRLLELCDEYDCNWTAIGEALGRSAASVKDKVRLLRNRKKTGKWDENEIRLLSQAVHEHTKTMFGESVTVGINWGKIAEQVNTRNEKQCFNKWLNYLNWKEAGGKKWIKTDEIVLINKIANSGIIEENKLDWNQLSNGWPCVRSPQWLRNKWWTIKKNVAVYKTCSFFELLTHLKGDYINSIWDKCKEKTLTKYIQEDKKNRTIELEAGNLILGQSAGDGEREGQETALNEIMTTTSGIVETIPLSVGLTDTLNTRIYSSYANINAPCYDTLHLDLDLTPTSSENAATGQRLLKSRNEQSTPTRDLLRIDSNGDTSQNDLMDHLGVGVGVGVGTHSAINMNMYDNTGLESLQQAIKAQNSTTYESTLSVVEGSDRMISEICDQPANSPLFES